MSKNQKKRNEDLVPQRRLAARLNALTSQGNLLLAEKNYILSLVKNPSFSNRQHARHLGMSHRSILRYCANPVVQGLIQEINGATADILAAAAYNSVLNLQEWTEDEDKDFALKATRETLAFIKTREGFGGGNNQEEKPMTFDEAKQVIEADIMTAEPVPEIDPGEL